MRWKSASLGSLILVESFGVLTKLAQWKQGFTDSARRKEQKRKASAVVVFRHVLPCLLLMSSVNVNLWQKRTMRVMNLQGNAI